MCFGTAALAEKLMIDNMWIASGKSLVGEIVKQLGCISRSVRPECVQCTMPVPQDVIGEERGDSGEVRLRGLHDLS